MQDWKKEDWNKYKRKGIGMRVIQLFISNTRTSAKENGIKVMTHEQFLFFG